MWFSCFMCWERNFQSGKILLKALGELCKQAFITDNKATVSHITVSF